MDSNTHSRQLSPPELTSLVRIHTHDVHNLLNSIDLELTLLGETTEDQETRDIVARLRQSITKTELLTRGLSTKLIEESTMIFSATDFVEQLKADATASSLDLCLEWSVAVDGMVLQICPRMMRSVLLDVLQFACLLNRRRMLNVAVFTSNEEIKIQLTPQDSLAKDFSTLDDMQKNIWSACRRLIEGNKGSLLPETLADISATFPICVTLPCGCC